jgi:ribosome-binding protein aMBF1 (putative translation factor)
MNCVLCGNTIRHEHQNRVGANLRNFLKICESCYILRTAIMTEQVAATASELIEHESRENLI